MAHGRRTRGRIPPREAKDVDRAIEACVKRIGNPKDAQYFREMLTGLVRNQVIPVDLLEHVPLPARTAGKTRFDQIYDATMSIVFPGYRRETLEKLLGPVGDEEGTRIWRAVFPEKFGVAHVLLRAETYQEAFALAADWACRCSLRLHHRVPHDLTVRVIFMGERALRRYLDMRWASKTLKRRELKLVGRDFTYRQVNGARLAALGHHPKTDPRHSVAKYAEMKDLQRVRERAGLVRISAVEHESPAK